MPSNRSSMRGSNRADMDYYEYRQLREKRDKLKQQAAQVQRAVTQPVKPPVKASAEDPFEIEMTTESNAPLDAEASADQAEIVDAPVRAKPVKVLREVPVESRQSARDEESDDDLEDESQNRSVGSVIMGLGKRVTSIFRGDKQGYGESQVDEYLDNDVDPDENEEDEEDERESVLMRALRFIGIKRSEETDEDDEDEDVEEDEPVKPRVRVLKPAHEGVSPAVVAVDVNADAVDVEDVAQPVESPFASNLTFNKPMSEVDPIFTLDIDDYPEEKRAQPSAAKPEKLDDEDDEEYDEDDEDEDEGESFLSRLRNGWDELRARFSRGEDDGDDDEDEEYEEDDEYEEDEDDDEYDEIYEAKMTKEGDDFMADIDKKGKSLADLLAEELDSKPSLSRRERRAIEARGSVGAATAQANPSNAAKSIDQVDEPTQEFKPLRSRAPLSPSKTIAKHKISREDIKEEDDDDEEEEIVLRRPTKKQARRTYVDEAYDDEDEDDDYDDYNARDDDDDDDDYYDDDEPGAGRHIISFFKAIVAIVLVLTIAVLALRQLESSRVLSLDPVRNTIGRVIPLDGIFPDPKADVLDDASNQPNDDAAEGESGES